ncbi:MAG TPA: permease-like cell division protein FtsX [Candidatus Acidoferrales bacterium]|nr:permease-like cell division protein FtsX [Candidatus Acidoferrales bacterium]
MDWGKVQFFLGEVLSNFARSKGMQITAIATVAVTIFMLGSFLYARETLSKLSAGMLSRIEISVYLADRADDKQGRAMAEVIGADPRVSGVTYIPKAEGLRQLQDRLRGQIDTSLLTSNPLPNAIRVRVKNPDMVPAVAKSIQRMRDIASVEYDQATVAKVLRLTETIAKLGLIMIVVLIFAAAVIISNTIRLTVFARRREIAIMQLVGATNLYIRAPFMAEGFIAGTIGALVAVGVLAILQAELVPKMMVTLSFIPFSSAHVDEFRLMFELLAAGAVVGVIGAWISVSRYLRV